MAPSTRMRLVHGPGGGGDGVVSNSVASAGRPAWPAKSAPASSPTTSAALRLALPRIPDIFLNSTVREEVLPVPGPHPASAVAFRARTDLTGRNLHGIRSR